jgi:hypothetical protein
MARGPVSFKQRDVTRALRAAGAAGIEVQRVEIDREGKIILVTGKPREAAGVENGGNEWDQV